MSLEYNIFLEAAVIPMDIVLCCFLVARYTNPTKVNVTFRRFAFIIMAADIVDVITAIVTSANEFVPNSIHYFFNITDSVLAAFSGLSFVYYIYAYDEAGKEKLKHRNMINTVLMAVDLSLLLTNPITGWVFTYDADGQYIHQALFVPVAYGFPFLFYGIGSAYMLTHQTKYKKRQVKTLVFAMLFISVFFLLQMLFFDNVLITFFVASIGVLVMFLSLETPDYVRLVKTLNELHESQVKEAAAEARAHLSQEMMLALAKAVDAKDHYTNGHSVRVAHYAKMIAKRMGKSEKEQDDIYSMGLLHDIGKIGVPEDIINKKGKLTDEEYAVIKKHTVIGWEILKNITEIPELANGARWHHERYDGKGYPDGIAGEEIPEAARIICVADCYDAMTSKRSYSFPRPQKEVRDEIVRCSGTQFDPKIAEILVSMIDEDAEYLLREKED